MEVFRQRIRRLRNISSMPSKSWPDLKQLKLKKDQGLKIIEYISSNGDNIRCKDASIDFYKNQDLPEYYAGGRGDVFGSQSFVDGTNNSIHSRWDLICGQEASKEAQASGG